MKFARSEDSLSEGMIAALEAAMGLQLPKVLKTHYLKSNGGSPEPYIYEDENLDTVVAECLPLASSRGKRTAPDTYRTLVLSRKLVPSQFFPFAVDGGGDYFFVNCSSPDGAVFFYRSDTADDQPLLDLGVGFAEFWTQLKAE